ncbi:ATP-binding protein [Patescibacteria group bacterium]
MQIRLLDALHNIKIRYKILLIFVVLFLLMLDLGALNITSVTDIRSQTQQIADVLIPRLVNTSTIKDNLNISILSAYDYVQTGNIASKQEYEKKLGQALVAQIELFYLSQSESDFEFTTSFESHINSINDTLRDLITTYEAGGSSVEIQRKLTKVADSRDAFAQFLEEEIEVKVQEDSQLEREQTSEQVQQTIINVAVVGVLALIALALLFSFVRKSITEPVKKLNDVAEDIGRGNFRFVDIDTRDELGTFADTFNTMTQRIKATQESLQIELEKTKRLDRQKTEFLSIAAHQLRTPMSGIKWVVGMAAEGDLGPVTDEAKDQLGKGLENIDRMIALINSLLDVTKIETDEFKYKFIAADPLELIEEICADFEHNAEEAGLKLTVEKPAQALPRIQADVEKLKMALRNIIDNGIKYTPKGGTVTISFEQRTEFVDINVSDTGVGIPKVEQERIFTKFYRGSNIQQIQADGSGLGLFIVREIVSGHEGSVTFESEEGKGTTFTVSIPVADPSLPTELEEEPQAGGASAPATTLGQ